MVDLREVLLICTHLISRVQPEGCFSLLVGQRAALGGVLDVPILPLSSGASSDLKLWQGDSSLSNWTNQKWTPNNPRGENICFFNTILSSLSKSEAFLTALEPHVWLQVVSFANLQGQNAFFWFSLRNIELVSVSVWSCYLGVMESDGVHEGSDLARHHGSGEQLVQLDQLVGCGVKLECDAVQCVPRFHLEKEKKQKSQSCSTVPSKLWRRDRRMQRDGTICSFLLFCAVSGRERTLS